MVTIRASHTIIPNQPTPQGRLWLSDSDQIKCTGHAPVFYIYKAKHNNEYAIAIERMCNSLSKILVHHYPIAGQLCLAESGRLEVECNAKGVTLLEAETTKSSSDYGDFSPSESIKELVPTIDYSQPLEERPLLVVQLTRFQGDQSLAIGMALSHPLADGTAWFPFINKWAKVARGETLEPNEMPFLDRTILKFSQSSSPRFDHPELKPLPLILATSKTIDEKQKKRIAALLKLTSGQVEILKKEANDESTKQGSISRPYSRYEAIAAHIWRCASKARQLDEHQPTLVRFNVNFRNRLIPPLPPNYFGNALAITMTPTCDVGEIMSNSLGYVAQKIREAIELLTNEHIKSQMNVLVGEGPLVQQGERLIVPYPETGNPNIHLTSWMNMPAYGADFGWGKPVYFGLGYVCPYDRAVISESAEGDGSVNVTMHLEIIHMQLFKKFFYQDIFTSRL